MYTTGWWPTRGDAAATDYTGEAACVKCHSDISALQHATPMYCAATPASHLSVRSPLKFSEEGYTYLLQQVEQGTTFAVNSVSAADSMPVAWAFGDAQTGQTYLLRQKDRFIESRLSYYTAPNSLDITVGHSAQPPSSLHDALGHELTFDTAQRCFGCHTTESTLSGAFVPQKAIPGVTCEACHGPGAAHIATAGRRGKSDATIFNPASMSPADSVDFCGACHRTYADVAVFMPASLGPVAVRFQPYRLEKSRCWGKAGDARITCIACHDPHKPLVKDAAAYDKECLACHRSAAPRAGETTGRPEPSASDRTAPACKIAGSKCVTCHMPKVEVPQTHAAFTDHKIQIAQSPMSSSH